MIAQALCLRGPGAGRPRHACPDMNDVRAQLAAQQQSATV